MNDPEFLATKKYFYYILHITKHPLLLFMLDQYGTSQSAGAVKYTDCISTEG